jgi:hypothetical protein
MSKFRIKVTSEPSTFISNLVDGRRNAFLQITIFVILLGSSGRAKSSCRVRFVASALNRQGIRPWRGRWSAHDLHLLMRRHRRAHPAAAESVGAALFHRRAEEARRVMRRLKRRGLRTQSVMARALNARGLTTPGLGRPWTARSVSRVLAGGKAGQRQRRAKAKLH